MTEAEKYLFDVHGYLVIEEALSAAEVAAANAAVDHHAGEIGIRPNDLANESATLRGTAGRGDLGGMLTWEKPHCDVFREMIAHPALTPYLQELLGPGFRLEGLGIITMDEGAEGFWFHEGGEPHDRSRGFLYRNGRMYCGMTNMAVQLTDVEPGDGGFACLPGSHKANFPCPDDIRLYHTHQDRIVTPAAKAGDAVLFENRLFHAVGPNLSTITRKTIFMGYSYRWLRPLDFVTQPPALIAKVQDDPIRWQLLGAWATHMAFSLPKDEDVPLRAWCDEHGLDAAFPDMVRPAK